MLTAPEKAFIAYWESNRLRKRKTLRQLYAGLPFAVVMVLSIVAITFSGWYQKADMALKKEEKSLILVLLAAVLAIVVFIVIFSARHRWDINEQRYRELLGRKD